MTQPFKPILLFAAAFAMAASATSAQAQFGKLFNDARRGAEKASSGCGEGESGDVARGALGGILGGIGRRTARRSGVTQFVPMSEFEDTLTTEIACQLDPEEQKQAAEATIQATSFETADLDPSRGSGAEGSGEQSGVEEGSGPATPGPVGPAVGQSASWTSGTRDNVTGTSTVTGRDETGDGSDCIFVTDIIIVEGEETRAEKRMCRPPGSARYSIVA